MDSIQYLRPDNHLGIVLMLTRPARQGKERGRAQVRSQDMDNNPICHLCTQSHRPNMLLFLDQRGQSPEWNNNLSGDYPFLNMMEVDYVVAEL